MENKGTAALAGTDKQIAWASDIRAKMLVQIASDRAQYEALVARYGKTPTAEHYAASARVESAVSGCTSAKALIDGRTLPVSVWTGPWDEDIYGERVDQIVARLS